MKLPPGRAAHTREIEGELPEQGVVIRFQVESPNEVVSYAELANMPQPGGRDVIENLSYPIPIFKEQVIESREVQGKE
jgi:hypothetical protein